jgi:hypothetical protein
MRERSVDPRKSGSVNADVLQIQPEKGRKQHVKPAENNTRLLGWKVVGLLCLGFTPSRRQGAGHSTSGDDDEDIVRFAFMSICMELFLRSIFASRIGVITR